ncbi:hypothetical protein KKG45_03405 [bacterium]|nr:hypothetical protein [bacterium]MBU1072273.1 hypothetical protein [bacterium]MBU1676529.1 hypothetical protein [bacterium]
MRRVIIVSILLFTSISSVAQDQDIIGVYFDEAAETAVRVTTGPNEIVLYWVAVKNMSATEDFYGIIFRLEENGIGVGGMFSLIGAQPTSDFHGNFMFSAQPPIPARDLILICVAHRFVLDANERIEFNIRPTDEPLLPFSPIY